LNLGNHVFPSNKYRLIKEKLLREGVAEPEDFFEALAVPERDGALVHDSEYIRKLQADTLSLTEILRLEVPYSPELVRAV
jgi:acetoin utilization deacetylase AcuC-like enzyme